MNPDQVRLVRQFGNKVYFGNLAHRSLLESAHIGDARLLALCIDDAETSLHIVEDLRRRYPNLRIMARARNRFHEIRQRNLGVQYVIREALLSGIEFARQVLMSLGKDENTAHRMVGTFLEQDTRLILQQAALVDDQASMVQSTKDAAAELKQLLQNEAAQRKPD
jgi:voltage-gated potassium channel Kch